MRKGTGYVSAPTRPDGHGVMTWLRRPEVTIWLRDNFEAYPFNPPLANLLNVGLGSLRGYLLYELQLRRMELDYWPEEAVAELRANFMTTGDTELALRFEQKYPKSKPWTKKHIEKKRKYLGLVRSNGALRSIAERQYGREASTPAATYGTWAAQGEVRLWRATNGVWGARVKVGKKWLPAGRYFWEQTNGPVPAGFKLIHRDRDATNYALENMELVPTGDVPRRSHNGARDLSDKYVAAQLVGCRAKIPKAEKKRLAAEFLKQPELLHLKRNQLLLRRAILSHDNQGNNQPH